LSGRAADPDGDALRIDWMASSGQFDDLHAINTIYTAPILSPDEECRVVDVHLRVADSCGNVSQDTQQILVYPVASALPVVDAGPATLTTSTRILTLDMANAYDPKGGQVHALWNIVRGCGSILGEATVNPTLVFCPDSDDGAEVLLALSAVDEHGNRATDTVLVKLLEGPQGKE